MSDRTTYKVHHNTSSRINIKKDLLLTLTGVVHVDADQRSDPADHPTLNTAEDYVGRAAHWRRMGLGKVDIGPLSALRTVEVD
jgi:hypothetical protein